jgi:hypothetical protein
MTEVASTGVRIRKHNTPPFIRFTSQIRASEASNKSKINKAIRGIFRFAKNKHEI